MKLPLFIACLFFACLGQAQTIETPAPTKPPKLPTRHHQVAQGMAYLVIMDSTKLEAYYLIWRNGKYIKQVIK